MQKKPLFENIWPYDEHKEIPRQELYVCDLHPKVEDSFLLEMFNRVGPAFIQVYRDTVTGQSLGYAYVNFCNAHDAERALDTMNFTEIKLRPCRIMWSQRDPSIRKSGVGKVFVNNLAPQIDSKGLFDIFSIFGNILSCKVATDEKGVSKGYGYVHYETAEAAQEAIQKIDGYSLEDQVVSVENFIREADHLRTNLYVKQFPKSWTSVQLGELFSQYGPIKSISVKESGGESFGLIDFAQPHFAKKALEELHGRTLEVPGEAPFTLHVNQRLVMNMASRGYPQQQQHPPQQQEFVFKILPPTTAGDLTNLLASVDLQTQKNFIGEQLYPLICSQQPQMASKITGMLLEMENSELFHLIESPEALLTKIDEALAALQADQPLLNSPTRLSNSSSDARCPIKLTTPLPQPTSAEEERE